MLPDLLLMISLGFLGSFGHCATMCGPVAVAFGLSGDLVSTEESSQSSGASPADLNHAGTEQSIASSEESLGSKKSAEITQSPGSTKSVGSTIASWHFHGLLNLGRLLSYGLVGAAIGAVGEVLLAGGQLAGVGSELRRWMTLGTGGLLLWLGLVQVSPGLLPRLPITQFAQQQHQRLSQLMVRLSLQERAWTPLLLGLCWGMIPCGFLYTAQIRAAETGQWWQGALLMLAFGLGTSPIMVGVGWMASRWTGNSKEQPNLVSRSQLYRLGGWVTLTVGLLLLLRNGDSHGGGAIAYGALSLLILALIARPLAQLGRRQRQNPAKEEQPDQNLSDRNQSDLSDLPPWAQWTYWAAHWLSKLGQQLMLYRRGLGVGAFGLLLVHIAHIYSINWGWNLQVLDFLVPRHRQSIALGVGAFGLMLPAALTSFDRYQKHWGALWRRIHLLTLPALLLAVGHTLLIATAYRLPGTSQGSWWATGLLCAITLGVLLLRWLCPLRR